VSAGLYVHIPFCRSRCAYCDFATQAVEADDPRIERYLAALEREWAVRGRDWTGGGFEPGGFETIYVGGGTPTWIGAGRLAGLARRLLAWAVEAGSAAQAARAGSGQAGSGEGDPGAVVEVTVEANPDSLDEEMAAGLIAAGVNRFSIGAQSFDDAVLAALGRAHDSAGIQRAVEAVRLAGRELGGGSTGRAAAPATAGRHVDVSLDLICGGPSEDDASWRQTVEAALALAPEHVSIYGLTLEEGTPLEAAAREGTVELPSGDEVADRLTWADERLESAGLARYEISNWARPGHECRHNLNYWRYGLYLGLGAGAVTRLEDVRLTAPVSLEAYLEHPSAGVVEEPLDACTQARERAMLGLRLTEGVLFEDLSAIARECPGLDAPARAARWQDEGLLEHLGDDRIRLTRRGMLLANQVLIDLVVE
jgi:oxygen-independent coproporphyrinogen III oxidase